MEILSLVIFLVGCVVIGLIFLFAIWYDKRHPRDANRCNCQDVNQCDKWCNAKENFTNAQRGWSIAETCKHPNILTRVLESSGTCETIIQVCADCDEPLSEPKTDCR